MEKLEYDVIIIGLGVSGAATAYTLSRYAPNLKIALFEKEKKVGQINSSSKNNSQTLHEGDIETNYNLDKATNVKHKASFTKKYVLSKNDKNLFFLNSRMILGVGEKEINFLEDRFNNFKNLFPELEKLNKKDLEKIEPNIVLGRDSNEKILALYRKNGLTIDYSLLAQHLIKDTVKNNNIDLFLDTEIINTQKLSDNKFIVETKEGKNFQTKFLSICAGAHSMYFAKKLDLTNVKNLSILSVAGNFYYSKKYINTKIYTVQNPNLPFSAVHGDPDIIDRQKTRFGPTTKIIFQLERRNYKSVLDFFKTIKPIFKTFFIYLKIFFTKDFFLYGIKHNFIFIIPFLGKYLFTQEIKKIIPTIKSNEIQQAKGQGGVRPQIINLNSKQPLNLGEAKIEDKNLLINITPSPGATTCMYNGIIDAEKITIALNVQFNKNKILSDFEIEKI